MDLPSGVVTKYYYDTVNRLTNMTHQAGITNLASYTYTLNASGRRTNAVEVLLTETGTYYTNNLTWQFDGMYRLTNEINLCSVSGASYTNAYGYDLAGNRLKLTQTAGNTVITTNSYDANDELFREVVQTNGLYSLTNNYGYDLNGSVIGQTNIASTLSTNIYTYDLRNKLSSVTSGNSTASFQYNDQGIRVRSTGSVSNKYYLIDANNNTGYQQVLEEFSTLGGTPTMSYVIGDDVLAEGAGGSPSAPSYFLTDGHGSTRQIVSTAAGITSHYSYDSYGITQSATSSSNPETSLLYCREQYDSTTQMYNLRARYYNPSNGRFNQRDTFVGQNEDPQSFHKYAYCNLDPINESDPNGYQGALALEITLVIALLVTLALVSPYIVFKQGPINWPPITSSQEQTGTSTGTDPGEQPAPEPDEKPPPPWPIPIPRPEGRWGYYVHYSHKGPEAFVFGIVPSPRAWVTDVSNSGLDAETAYWDFGLAQRPKYEYLFYINSDMLGPADNSTPGRRVQYEVLSPTGPGSFISWRKVPPNKASAN